MRLSGLQITPTHANRSGCLLGESGSGDVLFVMVALSEGVLGGLPLCVRWAESSVW